MATLGTPVKLCFIGLLVFYQLNLVFMGTPLLIHTKRYRQFYCTSFWQDMQYGVPSSSWSSPLVLEQVQ